MPPCVQHTYWCMYWDNSSERYKLWIGCLVAKSWLTLLQTCGLQPARLLCPWDSLGKIAGVGCHFLLQGIFPTQGSNPCLLHCRQVLYHWAAGGAPWMGVTSKKWNEGLGWNGFELSLYNTSLNRVGCLTDACVIHIFKNLFCPQTSSGGFWCREPFWFWCSALSGKQGFEARTS